MIERPRAIVLQSAISEVVDYLLRDAPRQGHAESADESLIWGFLGPCRLHRSRAMWPPHVSSGLCCDGELAVQISMGLLGVFRLPRKDAHVVMDTGVCFNGCYTGTRRPFRIWRPEDALLLGSGSRLAARWRMEGGGRTATAMRRLSCSAEIASPQLQSDVQNQTASAELTFASFIW